ncbi:ABC transporter permease [Paenibacillus marinisediminis]
MSYFSGLVRNEWMKTYTKRQVPYYVIFLILMVVGIGTVMRLFMMESGSEFGSLDFMNVMASVISAITLYFMISISAQTITDEFKDGTIKQLLIRPASRTTIMMSKLVNLIMITIVVYVITVIVAWITGLILFSGENSATFGEVIRDLIFSLPSLFFYSLLAFLMAVLTRSIGLSITVPIITQSIIAAVVVFWSKKSWYMLLIFPNLDWKPYFIDGYGLPYTGASLGLAVLIYCIYMMVMLLAAIFIFNKRDIQ